jgi:hypothetical protein
LLRGGLRSANAVTGHGETKPYIDGGGEEGEEFSNVDHEASTADDGDGRTPLLTEGRPHHSW